MHQCLCTGFVLYLNTEYVISRQYCTLRVDHSHKFESLEDLLLPSHDDTIKLSVMPQNLTVQDLPGIAVTYQQQIGSYDGPITFTNTFMLASPETKETFLAHWVTDAGYMKAQDGMLKAQLHRGVGTNNVFVNVAVWESAEKFRRAFGNAEFQKSLARCPPDTSMFPVITTKVAVPGLA